MSTPSASVPRPRACPDCARRAWLLSELSGPLECCARDHERLIDLLALPDEQLLAALAGRRRLELRASYASFQGDPADTPEVESTCRHRASFPGALCSPAAPHMLEVAGGVQRLAALAAAPVVAILGSRAASDYGLEMARCLARGLAASGVSVAASLADGIALAAHAGALEAGGSSVAAMGGGLGVSCPPRRRSLFEHVQRTGCAISELPYARAGRRWGALASERIVVELASVVVLVEAGDSAAELAGARIAQALGRALAAIPGRVSSRLSRGPHRLLMDGAQLVTGPHDVLELLHSPDPPRPHASDGSAPLATTTQAGLAPALRTTLERVAAGCDTAERLTRAAPDPSGVLLALSELELRGLLVRGDGGRYLPRYPSNG